MQRITKDLKRSGIYMLLNNVNGKRYIGSSRNIFNRLFEHRALLRHNKHHNLHILNAWNKYGEDNFSYQILEYCCEENRIQRELFFVDNLKPEYNISLDIVELPSYSLESRQKHSRTRKARMATGEISRNNCTKIYVYDLEGNFIKDYEAEADARRELHLTRSGVDKVLSGYQTHHHGYRIFRAPLTNLLKYVRTRRISKLYKRLKVYNEEEYYEFDNATSCAEYFNSTMPIVRYCVLHNRKFLKKYTVEYISAVS